jgi:hypothetical protein
LIASAIYGIFQFVCIILSPIFASIECRRTHILIEVSLALDFAGHGTSPAGVKLGLYLVYLSVYCGI